MSRRSDGANVTIEHTIAALERTVDDPRQGLPEEIFRFVSRLTPLVNVDLLIQDERRGTLLTWRDDEFFGAGWHLPGGIIRYKETAGERVRACARHELGVDVTFEDSPVAVVEDIAERDTRGHHIAMLYRCRLLGELPTDRAASESPLSGQWRWHTRCPKDILPVHAPYAKYFLEL